MVMTAPTMVRSAAMPGNPESLGLMLMSIGSSPANEGAAAVRVVVRSRTADTMRAPCGRGDAARTGRRATTQVRPAHPAYVAVGQHHGGCWPTRE